MIEFTPGLKMNSKKLTPWWKFEFAPYIRFEKFQMQLGAPNKRLR